MISLTKSSIIFANIFIFKCHRIALQDGLSKNFVNAEVNAVDCPDLSNAPFNLAAKGRF